MSKLTKKQAKAHQAACDLLAKDALSHDEKWFVLENWQESAAHINSMAGAFFTPPGLASDFVIDVTGRRIIDLCAGIGMLSFTAYQRGQWDRCWPEIVCIEANADYVAVGRKILPEATWICADVFDVPTMNLGHFDCAISNPPFGATPRNSKKSPRYTGSDFEYHVIDIASDVADYGAFILPQMSAPFTYSGKQHFSDQKHEKYLAFEKQTAIELTNGCGVDTAYHQKDWRGVSPIVEIVLADFCKARARRMPAPISSDQIEMFREAAE